MAHKYEELAERLRIRIEAGEWAVGTKLPGINRLAKEYRVGTDRMREAIVVLELDGLVVVRPGRAGTVVRDAKAPRHRLDLGDEVRRNELGYLFGAPTGHWSPVRMPTRGATDVPDEVAELLGVAGDDQVFARYRAVGPNGQAQQITTTYLHPDVVAAAPIVAEADTLPGGILDRLEQNYRAEDLGLGPLEWEEDIISRPPSPAEALELGMSTRRSVLVRIRAARDSTDRVVAADVMVVDGDKFSIRRKLRRADSARWPTSPAQGRNLPVGYTPADTPSTVNDPGRDHRQGS